MRALKAPWGTFFCAFRALLRAYWGWLKPRPQNQAAFSNPSAELAPRQSSRHPIAMSPSTCSWKGESSALIKSLIFQSWGPRESGHSLKRWPPVARDAVVSVPRTAARVSTLRSPNGPKRRLARCWPDASRPARLRCGRWTSGLSLMLPHGRANVVARCCVLEMVPSSTWDYFPSICDGCSMEPLRWTSMGSYGIVDGKLQRPLWTSSADNTRI